MKRRHRFRTRKERTRDHILVALHDLDAGVPSRLGRSVKYDLVHEGRRYSPKAVLEQAMARLSGSAPDPYAFTGDDMTNKRAAFSERIVGPPLD
jgi:5-methylcytosine-specific restriction protein B